jgi:hypothetical protein
MRIKPNCIITLSNTVYRTVPRILAMIKAENNRLFTNGTSKVSEHLHKHIRSHDIKSIQYKASLLSKKLRRVYRFQALRIEERMIKVTYTSLYPLKEDSFRTKHRVLDEMLVIEFYNLANSHASFAIKGAGPHNVDDEGNSQGSKDGA